MGGDDGALSGGQIGDGIGFLGDDGALLVVRLVTALNLLVMTVLVLVTVWKKVRIV